MDDRRRDGGINSTLRIKKQGTHLTLNEHEDDDDDEILNYITKFNNMEVNRTEHRVKPFVNMCFRMNTGQLYQLEM